MKPGLMYVAVSRDVHRDCFAFDPVEVNELGDDDYNLFEGRKWLECYICGP